MTPRQYQRVKELFRAALDLPPSERARWVGEHAGDEEVVRGEVLDMLAEDEHSDAAGEQLESGAAGMFAASLADESIPQQIGRYRVLRRVGEGGMGTVYEAQQQNPRRRVALKVIRAGLRREEAFKRFQREANVLGLLLHPGIAQVYEAGVAEAGAGGQPFIAMEFVEGVPLDRHVRDTATDARWILEAAARICEALHYAHEKGVVHRDLKPENILVVGGSSPVQLKIVDFGVARITAAEEQAVTLATAAGQLVGTLAYMSPEQVSGDSRRVDRRSDVYAVGVMLYELLSGVRPYDLNGVSIAEAARKICEEEPMALGAINSKFRGDVETIVAKAMEKDPQRRYPSAAALAADLRRYLANEPILARPPSTIYQIRKFAARNKAFVGSVVATFLALGVGLGLATYGFLSASRERNVAQAERQEKEHALQNEQAAREASDAVTEFLTETLAAADPANAGRNVTVREALDNAAGAVGTKFADKPLIDARIRYALAQTYVGLGEYAKALEQAEPAVEIFERLTGRFSRQSLDSRTILGEVYYFLGRATQALGEFETVLANRRAAPAPDDFGLATAASNVAFILTAQQKYAEAEPLFREALALQERAAGPDDATSIDLKGNLARLFLITGRLEDAQTLYEDVLARSRRVRGAEHPQTVLTMSNLAVVYSRSGQPDAARALLEEALEIQRRVLGESHSQTLITLNNLATELNGLGEGQRAIELLRDGLARAREAYGDTHPRTRMLVEQLGRIATDMGDGDAAEAYLEEHARLTKEAEGPGSRAHFVSHLSLARHYLARAAYGRAEPLIAEMLDELGEPAEDTATCWWDFRRLAALCALRQQRYAEAEAILRDLERLSSPAVATAAEQIPSPSADTVPERAAFAWGAERRAQLLDDLVALYESWNRPADAAHWKKQRPEVASDAASSAR